MGLNKSGYPSGNPQGTIVFRKLLELSEAEQYDDKFLTLLIQYHQVHQASEKFEIFYAKYALAHGNVQVALEEALKAEKKRPLNFEVWKLLATCYRMLGQLESALIYDGFCSKLYKVPIQFTVPKEKMSFYLEILTRAMNRGDYAPFLTNRCQFENGTLREVVDTYAGQYIKALSGSVKDEYWVGVYSEPEVLNGKGCLLERNKSVRDFVTYAGAGFQFDLMKSDIINNEIKLDIGRPYILPIAGSKIEQEIQFQSADVSDSAWLGKWQYSFFRIEKPISIRSEQPFIVGKPIYLGHSSKRRKVLLNILVDGLPWCVIKEQGFRYVPNLLNFFKKGIIFNNNFSVAEYTYPSLATIETGMYPHHSMIFNLNIGRELDAGYKTMSEMLKDAGYYCVGLCTDGSGVYNGIQRGYDRMITSAYALHMHVGVERAIQQMEAFGECDQMISLHVMDTHPWSARSHQIPVTAQTRLPLNERLSGAATKVASVYLPNTPLYETANIEGIKNIDRSLGILFNYLESHYSEDEYAVHLYSDHGVPVYDQNPSILSEHQVGAALMVRGSGVPPLGFVDELTSTLDIYPIVSYTSGGIPGESLDGNLPAALGGKEREYAISNSIYPGQTYKLTVWTKSHEFQLESLDRVDEDGTVDLSGAKFHIYTRKDHSEVHDEFLLQYFFGIARKHTESFNNSGHFWPSMRAARPDWFLNNEKNNQT